MESVKIDDNVLSNLGDFNKTNEGYYSDGRFVIKKNHLGKWTLHILTDTNDNTSSFIKELKSLLDLMTVYRSITDEPIKLNKAFTSSKDTHIFFQ